MARDVGVAERTLRRAVRRGTVRSRRPGARQLELAAGERVYLRKNWGTIATIARALRTERNVRLAVIFGSLARGGAGAGSDVDVMVSLAQERPLYLAQLTARLGDALGRDVDVLSLSHLRARDPVLLAAILRDGRPVIDRDNLWFALLAERDDIECAATTARAKRHRRAARAVRELIGG